MHAIVTVQSDRMIKLKEWRVNVGNEQHKWLLEHVDEDGYLRMFNIRIKYSGEPGDYMAAVEDCGDSENEWLTWMIREKV